MAISKEILNNKKKTNKPKPLGTVPENNPDHVSRPVDFHYPIPPKPILYNSFDEAVAACELIFLKPGEAHTEFYKIDNTYHCVVAIGNIYANHKHLYLTDSGNILSIDEQFALLKGEIIQLSKQFSLLDKHVDNLEDKINVFEENLNQGLSEIHQALVELEQFKNDINIEVQRIDNKVNNQAAQISALQRQDANINSSINKINSSISYINASIYQNTKDINNLKTHCSNIDSSILSVKNNIQIINTSVNLNTEQIVEIKEHNTTTDTSIQLLQDNVQIINTSVNLNTEQIDEIKEHNVIVDNSINNLQIEIENFQSIIDASIPPLFHDDIYTVNLCCYTAGGHIEIYDYYDESRVADCTPHNEYKTYVNGDSVDLVAVPNIGYKFVGWAKNADIEHLIMDSSIHVGFTDKDINVKGKIINMPLEPVLVENGYTALFEKLHTISIDIDVNVIGKSGDPVYHGDRFKVIINDVERTDVPYYFEAGSKVQLIPVVIPGHDFNYLTVNYTQQKYYDQYINEHCEEDLFVFANFTEYWSEVTADCQPAGAGQITSEHGIGGTYLYGKQIDLKANVMDGYEFIGWEPEHPSHLPIEKLERDIAPYTLNSSYIVLNVNKDITKYELRADFKEIEPPGPITTKFTRETIDGITEDKEYIFVAGTNGDEYNIALNANYNSGYFNIYSAYIKGGIDDKDEFEFNETSENPLYVIKLEYDADNNGYYIKNNETGKYVRSASSGNKFVEIDEKDESALWTISDEMEITNNASGKIIGYNISAPIFTNYSALSATIIQAHLFYKNNRRLLFLTASNHTPSLQNIVFHEALAEDEN